MDKKVCHIWHHNDNDGRLSAYIAARALRRQYGDDNVDIVLHEMDYSKQPDFRTVESGSPCVITDFSFSPEKMRELLAITDDVIWIDNHKTAIEALADVRRADGSEIRGIRGIEDSATLLAWNYFNYPVKTVVPEVVALVDDYDAWKHKLGGTMAFHLASAMNDTNPGWHDSRNFWARMLDNPASLDYVKQQGQAIREYVDFTKAERLAKYGWIGRMAGYDGDILCLSGVRGSKSFDSADDRPAVLCAYEHDGEKFNVSLYSDQGIDVSEICKMHGGGGHKGAAGFIRNSLPILFQRKYK